MSLYERNQVVKSEKTENKKAIFCSFECPDDNEYDYLILSELNQILISATTREYYDYIKDNVSKLNIDFNIAYDETSDPQHIILSNKSDDELCFTEKIELQTFVDSLCRSRYNDTEFEREPEIKKAIDNILSKISIAYFEEKGLIVFDTDYRIIGRIFNKEEELIAIIDSLNISQDQNTNSKFTVKLNNMVSYLPFENLDIGETIFIGDKYLIQLYSCKVIKAEEEILRNYTVNCVLGVYEKTSEDLDKLTFDYSLDNTETEDFFDLRVQELVDRDKFFGKTNQIKINNAFDDFDF